MNRISFAIIAHNEEDVVRDCLESIAWADEIIFVDCESTDRTAEIAATYGVRLFRRKNERKVYINKQFAIDKASGDWIFVLDPDERIGHNLKQEIKASTANPRFSAYKIPRKNFYLGKWLKKGGKYPDFQLRLFRKGKGKYKPLPVHEILEINGPVGKLKNPMEHLTLKNVSDAIRKADFFSDIISENYLSLGLSKTVAYKKALFKPFANYLLKFGFMDGKEGFAAAAQDFYTLLLSALRYEEKLKLANSDDKQK